MQNFSATIISMRISQLSKNNGECSQLWTVTCELFKLGHSLPTGHYSFYPFTINLSLYLFFLLLKASIFIEESLENVSNQENKNEINTLICKKNFFGPESDQASRSNSQFTGNTGHWEHVKPWVRVPSSKSSL